MCRSAPVKIADTRGRGPAPPEAHLCELLSREVLVDADPAANGFEVQNLRFAMPPGATVAGPPPGHIKARAPDVPGQRMRVRAYSMMMNEGAHGQLVSFNVTVKINPGQPPMSRATSAHLGQLLVGESLWVPEIRSMSMVKQPTYVFEII